eukprot:TRINITY_DN23360_c0_g1_i1.p1 TRINITY_DN23360_c0_g1~~TRINITY_DN23360_c0_g1_i1.p1  ORF type:complete len:494 (-),score=236.73 TRINITY_DN23360_c0_g1_i1:66-1547(-)
MVEFLLEWWVVVVWAELLTVLLVLLLVQWGKWKLKGFWREVVSSSRRYLVVMGMCIVGLFISPTWVESGVHPEIVSRVRHVMSLGLTMTILIVLVRMVTVVDSGMRKKWEHDGDVDEDAVLQERAFNTRLIVLRRFLHSVIAVIGVIAFLTTFPLMENFVSYLVVYSGLIALAVGLAVQPLLGNLVANVQVGLTQPIRIGDAITANNEYGRVERITATYVQLAVWDGRRMILPLSEIISRPIINFTRVHKGLLNPVKMWLDFRTPIEPLRQHLKLVLQETPLWDGVTASVDIVDMGEYYMQVRFLVSSKGPTQHFRLGHYTRERMICFLREQYPFALPRMRNEVFMNSSSTVEEEDQPSGTKSPAQVKRTHHRIGSQLERKSSEYFSYVRESEDNTAPNSARTEDGDTSDNNNNNNSSKWQMRVIVPEPVNPVTASSDIEVASVRRRNSHLRTSSFHSVPPAEPPVIQAGVPHYDDHDDDPHAQFGSKSPLLH